MLKRGCLALEPQDVNPDHHDDLDPPRPFIRCLPRIRLFSVPKLLLHPRIKIYARHSLVRKKWTTLPLHRYASRFRIAIEL